MSGRRSRRRKRLRRRRKAMAVGASAVALLAALGVVVPWIWFQGEADRYGPLMVFCAVMTLGVSFFVYFGASRFYAPELPMALVQFQHGHAASGDAVVLHTGTKFQTASRRRSLVALGIGVTAWALGTAAFGRSLGSSDQRPDPNDTPTAPTPRSRQ